MSTQRLPPQILLAFGNQPHPLRQSAEALVQAVLSPEERSIALYRFDAREIVRSAGAEAERQIDDVRGACETVPLLSERFVVWVSGFEAVKAPAKDDGGPPAARLGAVLLRALTQPPPGCWLILTGEARNEKEFPAKLLKAIRAQGRIDKFVTYDDQAPVDWVLKDARGLGLNLKPPHARVLIDAIGNDMGRLHRELEKFALLFDGEAVPDEAQWRAVIHGEQHSSLFYMAEQLGARDLGGALAILEQFLQASGNELPMLVGILARHFRQLYRLTRLQRQGVAEPEVARQLKVHPFILKKLAAQAGGFSAGELEAILTALARIDLGFRRHPHLTPPILRDFVQGVCTHRYRGARVP
jgi:DNA polymerase-3 subunit delta